MWQVMNETKEYVLQILYFSFIGRLYFLSHSQSFLLLDKNCKLSKNQQGLPIHSIHNYWVTDTILVTENKMTSKTDMVPTLTRLKL